MANASAWSNVLTMKGKSKSPSSFTTLASDVVDAVRTAAYRGLLLQLVAELRCWKLADFQFPATLGCEDFGELLHAEADRMISVVEMAPADRPLLNLRGGRYRANNASDGDERAAQFP
jgi:hypothetical protein